MNALSRCLAILAWLITSTAQAQVGFSQLQLGGVPTTLVYPTAEPTQPMQRGPFLLQVAPEAVPVAGRRRLVVMSHGTGGSALADHELAATLARAGFVVAQPAHGGDNHADFSKAGPEAWISRPLEVSRVIDALAVHPSWRERLRLDRVGVHGMSAGAVTALSLAGGRWRVLDLLRHCAIHTDEDLGFCFNGLSDPAAQAARRASYARIQDVPEAQLPEPLRQCHGGRSDPRIAAITLAVPVAAIFSAESLAGITIPVGVVSAGRDRMLLPGLHSQRVLAHAPTAVSLARLAGAGHFDLLSPWPPELARAATAQQPRGGELEAGFDPAERSAAFAAIAEFLRLQLAS